MKTFIASNVIPNATKVIAFVCGTLGGPDSSKSLKTFVPFCTEKILDELEGGASQTASGMATNITPFGYASMSDAPFHYYQAILNYCVLTGGVELLSYRQEFEKVLKSTFENSVSRRGFKWSSKLLRNLLTSLLTVYPAEYRSHPKEVWEDKGIISKAT